MEYAGVLFPLLCVGFDSSAGKIFGIFFCDEILVDPVDSAFLTGHLPHVFPPIFRFGAFLLRFTATGGGGVKWIEREANI